MKKFTQAEFDALPRDAHGRKRCPTGDYSEIKNFGAGCGFGESCGFGGSCGFGESCSFENGHKARPGYPLLAIAGAGSANRTTYFFNTVDGIIVRSGCFKGALAEFRAKVREDGDALKSLQYLGFANIAAATWAPEEIEK